MTVFIFHPISIEYLYLEFNDVTHSKCNQTITFRDHSEFVFFFLIQLVPGVSR